MAEHDPNLVQLYLYLWLPQFSFLTSENTSSWGRSCSENLWKLHDRLTTVCWVEESSVPTRPVSVDQWCTMLLSSCTLQPRSQHPSPCLTPPPHHSSLHKPTSHQQFQQSCTHTLPYIWQLHISLLPADSKAQKVIAQFVLAYSIKHSFL